MAQAVTVDTGWLDAQLAGAPAELAARTRFFVGMKERYAPSDLADASIAALNEAMAHAAGRDGALDLLAADALLTLALAAQVEVDLDGIDALTRRLLDRYSERDELGRSDD